MVNFCQRWRGASVSLACATAALGSVIAGGCIEDVPRRSHITTSLVESVCDTACGCNRGRCEAWVAEQTEALEFLLEVRELTFDAECFETRLQQHADAGCQPVAKPEPDRCGYRCRLLYGERGDGEFCEQMPRGGSDCRPEFECIGGICVDPCDTPADRVPCDPFAPCPSPTSCDFAVGQCVPLPRQDEPCLNGGVCAGELTCIAGTCSGPREIGEPCQGHSGCLSKSCPNGFCAAPPGPGEPCQPLVPCADGRSCEDGVCDDGAGVGGPCPCRASSQSMVCNNGRCEYSDPLQCGGGFVIG